MNIAILGAGNVGGTLGRALAGAGHTITYAVRDPGDPKHQPLAADGSAVRAVREAIAGANAVILATPWAATEAALAGAGDFGGKPLIDATNPIGPGFTLTHGHTDSGAEQVARWAPSAHVVKAFNSTGAENMGNPAYGSARALMLVCGDDAAACQVAQDLARDLGFEPLYAGKLLRARLLEPMALMWINLAIPLGHGRDIAFGLLRR